MNAKCFCQGGILGVLLGITLSLGHAAAQGIVLFGNANLPGPPAGLERRVLMPDQTTPIAGTNFIAQLLYEDNSGTWVAHANTRRFFSSTSMTLRGYWQGAYLTLANAGGFASPTVGLRVRVWDGGTGATPLTFEQAQTFGGFWGQSAIFGYTEEFDAPGSGNDIDDKWMKNFVGGIWGLTPGLHFQAVSRNGNEFRFRVQGEGRTAIETRTSLNNSASWVPIYTNFPPFWFTNSTIDADQRFFRAVYR